jgi:hypothetical protein
MDDVVPIPDDDISDTSSQHAEHRERSGPSEVDHGKTSHPNVKRKPEQEDIGGAKKKVHIIISDDEDFELDDDDQPSDGGDRMKITTRADTRRAKQNVAKPVAKVKRKTTQSDFTSTTERDAAGGQPNALRSSSPARRRSQDDPFLGT